MNSLMPSVAFSDCGSLNSKRSRSVAFDTDDSEDHYLQRKWYIQDKEVASSNKSAQTHIWGKTIKQLYSGSKCYWKSLCYGTENFGLEKSQTVFPLEDNQNHIKDEKLNQTNITKYFTCVGGTGTLSSISQASQIHFSNSIPNTSSLEVEAGANSLRPSNGCSTSSATTPAFVRQLTLNNHGGFAGSFIPKSTDSNEVVGEVCVQCKSVLEHTRLFKGDPLCTCSFCEKLLCQDCLQECRKCAKLYCANCRLNSFLQNESSMVCVGCTV